MYTSGTPASPKARCAVIAAGRMLSLVTEMEMSVERREAALLVMPMCHANSLYFFGAFSIAAPPARSTAGKQFDPNISSHACRRRRYVHLAGADALHHDARPVRRRSAPGTTLMP